MVLQRVFISNFHTDFVDPHPLGRPMLAGATLRMPLLGGKRAVPRGFSPVESAPFLRQCTRENEIITGLTSFWKSENFRCSTSLWVPALNAIVSSSARLEST